MDRAEIDALVETMAADGTISADGSIAPPSPPVRLRERIDAILARAAELLVRESIGAGGRGVIRAAEQRGLGREVAVKAVRGERSDAAIGELLSEALITGALEHPNIVPVHYIGVDETGEPFIVLKKIEGVGWDELIGERDLEWSLRVLLDVINAIRFAHSRQIIHRDLKPANVMVGEFGEVYVLDWGLAVSLEADPGWLPGIDEVTGVAGTLAYMAPEMLSGKQLSERTDIYLLGAVLCEIATGSPPHRGRKIPELIDSIIESRPALDGAPAELAAIIERAMAPRPEDRYASAGELQQAIEAFLIHREAARLSDNAATRLDALLAALEAGAERERIYNLFGACRFGFREAIDRWPESQAASRGLERAVAAVVDYELARGESAAAQGLLSELADVPEPLRRRVESAVATEREKREALAALEADLDPSVAGGWRVVGAVILGLVAIVIFGVGPAAAPGWFVYPSWPKLLVIVAVEAAIMVTTAVILRGAVFASRPNRIYALVVATVIVATCAAIVGLWLGGADPDALRHVHALVWFSCFTPLIAAVDRRLWPAPVVLLGIAIATPSLSAAPSLYVLLAGLLAVIGNVAWVSARGRPD